MVAMMTAGKGNLERTHPASKTMIGAGNTLKRSSMMTKVEMMEHLAEMKTLSAGKTGV